MPIGISELLAKEQKGTIESSSIRYGLHLKIKVHRVGLDMHRV